jgi:hypothetical protein
MLGEPIAPGAPTDAQNVTVGHEISNVAGELTDPDDDHDLPS